MAKLLNSYSRPWVVISLLGILSGICYGLISFWFIDNIVENIAVVILTILGMIVMSGFRTARPVVVGVAVAIFVWGTGWLLRGMSMTEIVIYSGLIWTLTYLAFYWLARQKNLVFIVVVMAVLLILERLSLIFW